MCVVGAGVGGGLLEEDSIRCTLPWNRKLRSAVTEKREMKEDFWCFVESASSTDVRLYTFPAQ